MPNWCGNLMRIHPVVDKTKPFHEQDSCNPYRLITELRYGEGRNLIQRVETKYHQDGYGWEAGDPMNWNRKALAKLAEKRDPTPPGLGYHFLQVVWESAWGAGNPFSDECWEQLIQHDVRWVFEEPNGNVTGFEHWHKGVLVAEDYRSMWEHPVGEVHEWEDGSSDVYHCPLGYLNDPDRKFDDASPKQLKAMYDRRYEQNQMWVLRLIEHDKQLLAADPPDPEVDLEKVKARLAERESQVGVPREPGYCELHPAKREASA